MKPAAAIAADAFIPHTDAQGRLSPVADDFLPASLRDSGP